MQNIIFGAIAAAVATMGAGTTASALGPWYVSGSVGGYFRQDTSQGTEFFKIDNPSITAPGVEKLGFDSGPVGNVAVGYRVWRRVRVEGEFVYTSYNGSTLNPTASNANFPELNGSTFSRESGSRSSRLGGGANVFYDFNALSGRFTPYIGAGVGASANHRSAGQFLSASGAEFTRSGGSSTNGFGLVEGGVSIALSPHWSLVPAYRFVHYFESQEDVAHVVKIGLRYSF